MGEVLSAFAVLTGGLATYWSAVRKIKADQKSLLIEQAAQSASSVETIKLSEFAAIINANEDFRTEIRGDLELTRQESEK